MRILTLTAILITSPVAAHSWYPRDCCGDHDCQPADCADFTPVTPDGLSTYKGKRLKIRPSEDSSCHVCIVKDVGPLCGFLPGTS